MSFTALAPGESILIPSGTNDGRGVRLRRIQLPSGPMVVIEHTSDGETVEALALTGPAFNEFLAAAAGLR